MSAAADLLVPLEVNISSGEVGLMRNSAKLSGMIIRHERSLV